MSDLLELRIAIRWSDLDTLGHVNNAVYLSYLEEARVRWLDAVLERSPDADDYVLAHVSIDYRREVTLADEAVLARCQLERIGNSSVRTREEVVTLDGEVAASAEGVLVARDAEAGRSRPLSDAERAAFERAATSTT
jgi:acyl-CoA thioester hydrolase